jgi:hypothetical protein
MSPLASALRDWLVQTGSQLRDVGTNPEQIRNWIRANFS